MKYNNNFGFTLIELLIAVTIFFIIVVSTYANYAYYQNTASVRIGIKEVSQSINEARNLAINGVQKNGVNASVVINFDINQKDVITTHLVSHTGSINDVNFSDLHNSRDLPRGIEYSRFKDEGDNLLDIYDNILVLFNSISGVGEIYGHDGTYFIDLEDILKMDISFRGSEMEPLNKELKYYKNTNVIDY